MKVIVIAISALLVWSCSSSSDVNINSTKSQTQKETQIQKIVKTEEEWRSELTPDEFYVLREQGTEQAFTGDLWNHKQQGIYTCAGCDLELFSSETKFKSGTGWPSFYKPLNEFCIGEIADNSFGWNRVEVVCNRCGGHQGHVFTDGPEPTGLRYCINSVSMNFKAN